MLNLSQVGRTILAEYNSLERQWLGYDRFRNHYYELWDLANAVWDLESRITTLLAPQDIDVLTVDDRDQLEKVRQACFLLYERIVLLQDYNIES